MGLACLFTLCVAALASAQTFQSQSFRTESFTPPNMKISRAGRTQPGYLFFGPSGPQTASQAPIIMGDDNQLIWQGDDTEPIGPQDFKVQTYRGNQVLSYYTGFGSLKGGGLGQFNIFDNTYKRIATICPDITMYYTDFKKMACPLDLHEGFITPQNTILVTGYNVTKADLTSINGPKNGFIFDALFFEIDIATNEVLFTWRGSDHQDAIPFKKSNYPPGSTGTMTGRSAGNPWDYFHINSVIPVDGGYIINSRYYWSIFFINKDGSVRWTLEGSNGGDYTLDSPDIFFSFEHHVSQTADVGGVKTLTLFNNDNARPAKGVNASTGIEILVDTNKMSVSLSRKLNDPNDRIVAQAQGSHQSLGGGHALVGYGSVATVKEFGANNEAFYTAQFGGKGVHGYRTFKYEWSATPYWDPKVVAELANGGTDIWMSWNGATDIDSWNIYVGPKNNNLRVGLKGVKKTNFETKHSLDFPTGRVVVEAVRNGKGIRNSTILKIPKPQNGASDG